MRFLVPRIPQELCGLFSVFEHSNGCAKVLDGKSAKVLDALFRREMVGNIRRDDVLKKDRTSPLAVLLIILARHSRTDRPSFALRAFAEIAFSSPTGRISKIFITVLLLFKGDCTNQNRMNNRLRCG